MGFNYNWEDSQKGDCKVKVDFFGSQKERCVTVNIKELIAFKKSMIESKKDTQDQEFAEQVLEWLNGIIKFDECNECGYEEECQCEECPECNNIENECEC